MKGKSGAGGGRSGRKIKVGVFGAWRGRSMIWSCAERPDTEVVAVCDKNRTAIERVKAEGRRAGRRITFYTDADKFFNHDFDAVVLANYANEHAPFAIRALLSGRHVMSEVLAVQTLDEAVRLVETVEESGKVYSYAENYCYFRSTQEMRRLYKSGALGEFQHGEGEYVHNCEPIWPQIAYGDPNHWRNNMHSTFYCTHSLGPVIFITGTRPLVVVGFETPNTGAHVGMRAGSSAMICCQMSNGATVKSLHAVHLKREPSSVWYVIYGTKGMVESDRWAERIDAVNVFLEGDRDTPFEKHYVPEWAIKTGAAHGADGHGGGDFYTVHCFLEKILGRPAGRHSIDVYTALDMTVPGILAYKSILAGNRPFEMPDFRRKSDREKYRGDTFCTDRKVAGNQLAPNCSFPMPKIPKSVYARQRKIYKDLVKSRRWTY